MIILVLTPADGDGVLLLSTASAACDRGVRIRQIPGTWAMLSQFVNTLHTADVNPTPAQPGSLARGEVCKDYRACLSFGSALRNRPNVQANDMARNPVGFWPTLDLR